MGSTVPDHVGDFFGGRARLSCLPSHRDEHGTPTPVDPPQLPFPAARAFIVDAVPPGTVRGGHAHRAARQFLVATAGRVAVDMRLGGKTATVVLGTEGNALPVEPPVWARQTYLDAASRLVVSVDQDYDPASYVEDGPGEGG